jgi:hypothetical protein
MAPPELELLTKPFLLVRLISINLLPSVTLKTLPIPLASIIVPFCEEPIIATPIVLFMTIFLLSEPE